MHEWLEGLQKSAVRASAGAGQEHVQRAETEYGVPLPEELATLFRTFNGGEFQGDVTLFALHAPEGEPSVLAKTRLMVEGLPAAGLWRLGLKGAHRHLFSARKSALQEQAEGPLPGWAESLSGDDWIYGTWDTDARELRLYRSLQGMLEVLIPPPEEKEVEEFGDRTYARALSAVQGALSDLSVDYEDEGETPAAAAEDADEEDEAESDEEEESLEDSADDGAEADEEADEAADEEESFDGDEETQELPAATSEADAELSKPVVAAARRRMGKLREGDAAGTTESEATPAEPKKASARTRPAKADTAAPALTSAVKKAVEDQAPARTAPARKAPAPAKKAAPARKAAAPTKAAAKKTPAKKAAPVKKASAKKAAAPTKAAAKKAPAKKAAPVKKASAKKAPAKKASAPTRAAAKKAPAKKGGAKKAPAQKTATRASAAKKAAPAKNAAARKAPAKKGGARGRR